jgi:hypothetical protein
MKNGGLNDVKKCFRCGKEGHMSFNCPEFPNQPNSFRNGNQRVASNGPKVNHVNAKTAQEASEVMLGTFSVNSIPATILFDSGASHSFISQAFVRNHSIPLVAMKRTMIVNSPGETLPASYCCPSANIALRGVDFPAQPVVLMTASIDVILGMDWMKQHNAVIQC